MSAFDFHLPGSRKKGVLLIHGLTGSPAEMRPVGKALNRAGFTVYAPTLAGHCGTLADLLATRYEDWVDSVDAAITKMSQEVDELYLAGICVGGGLALYAAHTRSTRVLGVVIYSPLLNYDGWNTPFYYKWAPRGIPIMMRMPLVRKINFGESHPFGIKSDRIRSALLGNGGEGIAGTLPVFPARALYQNYRLNDALKLILPQVRIPTLLIHAREDDVGHPRNPELIQKLHGGRCDIIWLENSYHMIHIDQERNKVAALTANFFGIPNDNRASLTPVVPDAAGAEEAHG